jgi:hypothetical protein
MGLLPELSALTPRHCPARDRRPRPAFGPARARRPRPASGPAGAGLLRARPCLPCRSSPRPTLPEFSTPASRHGPARARRAWPCQSWPPSSLVPTMARARRAGLVPGPGRAPPGAPGLAGSGRVEPSLELAVSAPQLSSGKKKEKQRIKK